MHAHLKSAEWPPSEDAMVIALISVISLAALAQFGIFYWRALISVVAAAPVSERIREAAGISGETVSGADFVAFINLAEICPELKSDGLGIGLVRTYYRVVATLARICGPGLAGWACNEMATCSRYVAARLDQRIQHNRLYLAQVAR